MIELKPNPYNDFFCPQCGTKISITTEDIIIPGMNAFAVCNCSCGFQFYQILPVGHNVDAPLVIEKKSHKVYSYNKAYEWLDDVIENSFPLVESAVRIECKIFLEYDDVVILNTLDFLYGHSLLKLYNVQHHLDHDESLGLVLIVPKLLAWMIPKDCAEAWIVDLSLGELKRNYQAIADFVSTQMKRFKKVYLSKAYSHPDFTDVNIASLTGVEPFNLDNFYKTRPCVTFVLREDRWWFRYYIDYLLYRVGRRLKILNLVSIVLTKHQNYLVQKAIKVIRKKLPDAQFNIVGLGTPAKKVDYVGDERSLMITKDVEMKWCNIYNRSHVVIGVHGSNMLLPTAHAAGCVEILPDDRYGNMIQDISVRYPDRRQLFFYRFVPQYVSPKAVAHHALSIINDFRLFKRNMEVNLYHAAHDADQILL